MKKFPNWKLQIGNSKLEIPMETFHIDQAFSNPGFLGLPVRVKGLWVPILDKKQKFSNSCPLFLIAVRYKNCTWPGPLDREPYCSEIITGELLPATREMVKAMKTT